MGFFEVAEKRHSVRSFKKKPVEEEKLQRILNAISAAPSAGNLKAYKLTVVRDAKQKEALAGAALGQTFVAEAPIVLVFSADKEKSAARYGKRAGLYSLQDATIACAFAMLAAVEVGLSSCWVGAFSEEDVSAAISLPKKLRPIALLPIGYAGE